jgi:choline-glycine betaine transporter
MRAFRPFWWLQRHLQNGALILDAWPNAVGGYLSSLASLSSVTGAFGGADWMAAWTTRTS